MIWFCEYSAEQGCFHVAAAEDCVKTNLEILERGEKPSFVPVGLFASREAAVKFCQLLRIERSYPPSERGNHSGEG